MFKKNHLTKNNKNFSHSTKQLSLVPGTEHGGQFLFSSPVPFNQTLHRTQCNQHNHRMKYSNQIDHLLHSPSKPLFIHFIFDTATQSIFCKSCHRSRKSATISVKNPNANYGSVQRNWFCSDDGAFLVLVIFFGGSNQRK